MPQNTHLEMVSAEEERRFESSGEMVSNPQALRLQAAELARNLSWLPSESRSRGFFERCRRLSQTLKPILKKLEAPLPHTAISDDSRWLYDNVHLLSSELESVAETFRRRQKFPHVRTPIGAIVPRVAALAEVFLAETNWQFDEKTFTAYIETFQ